jgi:hypothetical protein
VRCLPRVHINYVNIFDFGLSPCFRYCMHSFGCVPGVRLWFAGPTSPSKPWPGYKYLASPWLSTLHTRQPAFEDGTDRGFRNVGKPQSDAGDTPKRVHTIREYYYIFKANFCEKHPWRVRAALWQPPVYRYLDGRKSNAICQTLGVETVYLSGPQTINFVRQNCDLSLVAACTVQTIGRLKPSIRHRN